MLLLLLHDIVFNKLTFWRGEKSNMVIFFFSVET